MTDIPLLLSRNTDRWNRATFKADSLRIARQVATRLVEPKAKAVYQKIEALTGVPWFAVAMIHEREAGQKWDRSIAQGDRWDRVSVHVPKGRGPFKSFIEAAVDALVKCPPYASKWKDWSPGGMLTLQEMYNGLGYANKGRPSAYIWSGTDQYKSGKYVSDGVYDPNVVDSQLGCAVMLKAMTEIDQSIYAAAAPIVDESADKEDEAFDPSTYPNAPPDITVPKPAEKADKTVVAGRAAAGTAVATAAGGKIIESVVGDSSDLVDKVTSVADKSGHIIDTTKQIVAVPKPGFWNGLLHFITSPGFLVGVIVVIAVSWSVVYFWQRSHRSL